jgi:Tol biopolymer transport system component
MRSRSLLRWLLVALISCKGDGITAPADPDTLEFAYTVTTGDYWQESAIWLMSGDGSKRRMLVDLPDGADRASAWSPDGSTLLFVHINDPMQQFSLWLVRADGTGLRQLPVGLNAVGGAWTPDGQEIVFQRRGNGQFGPFETMAIRPDGSGLRTHPAGRGTGQPLSWSPDGTRVAFERAYSIWVANVDATNEKQITSGTVDLAPSWSPDGSRIAFTTESPRSPYPMNIAVVNADGSGRRDVSPGPFDQLSVWSPDGQRIAYNRRTTTATSNVCTLAIVDAAGGTPRDVMPDVQSTWCPNAVWRRAPRSS